MANHTTGTWVIERGNLLARQEKQDILLGKLSGLDRFLCLDDIEDADEWSETDHELIANGLLIQAAPQLLVCCLKAESALSGAVTEHSRGCALLRQGEACDCWLKERREAIQMLRTAFERLGGWPE